MTLFTRIKSGLEWESALESCWQDLRHAIRTLRNSPGFSAVAVLTMSLGIGAATVIFSVVYNVLIDPLPYKDFDRSVVFNVRGLTDAGGWKGRAWFSVQEFLAFRDQNHVFEDLIGFSQNRAVLYDDGRSTRLFRGAYVTVNTFDYLGVPPLLGRSFTADDGRAGALPVFAMNYRLWQGEFGADPEILGRTFLLDGEPVTLVGIMPLRFNAFSADFRTLGLPLLRGTLFSEADVEAKRLVTVVNQTFGRRYLPGEDPLGKRVKFQVFDRPFLDAPHDTYFEIIGVVADHRTWGGEWQTAPQAFLPYSVQGFSFRTFLARTSVDSDSLLKSTREAIRAIDPRVGISASGSIDRSLRDFYRDPQFDLATLGAFAGIGLALVAIGIFSVMAYTVSLQTHEIGVRMALGARRPHILRMVLLRGLRLVVAGSFMGLVAAYACSSVLVSRISGVPATDPVTFVVVAAFVVTVGLTACLLPARQATRVDP